MAKLELLCKDYQIDRAAGELTEVRAKFLLVVRPNDVEEMANALKKIELFFGNKVNIVKSDGKPRCFYCGVSNNEERNTCESCGAPL